jgi:hypothetical protein
MAGGPLPAVIKRFLYRPITDGKETALVPGRLLMGWYWCVERKWSDLRAIGNSNASKLTVLFPIVGYLIIFNDDLVQHLNLWRPIFGETAPPYRLLCVYFGLICVSLAAAIYGVRCPPEIKRHRSAVDYIAEMEAYASTNRRNAIEHRLSNDREVAPILQQFTSDRRDAVARLRSTLHEREQEVALVTDYWRDVYGLSFTTLNVSCPRSRHAAWACYAIGFILLGLPSLNVLWRVLVYTWDLT